jgi:DNA-binding MarR family transcriptional regulator
MNNALQSELLDRWMSVTNLQSFINNSLESVLQEKFNLSLNEFYVLYILSQTDEKKLRLQQLQDMVSLSQSAISRLVGRMEAKSCGVLQRHVCTDDRRGIYTCLTELGEQKLQGALGSVEATLRDLLIKEPFLKELNVLNNLNNLNNGNTGRTGLY